MAKSQRERLTAVSEVTEPMIVPRFATGARATVSCVSKMREHWVKKQFTKSTARKRNQNEFPHKRAEQKINPFQSFKLNDWTDFTYPEAAQKRQDLGM